MTLLHKSLHLLLLFLFLSTCCLPSINITNNPITLPPSTISNPIPHTSYYVNIRLIDEMIKHDRKRVAYIKTRLEDKEVITYGYKPISLHATSLTGTNPSHQKQLTTTFQSLMRRLTKCNRN
jgi:hypothetical protein